MQPGTAAGHGALSLPGPGPSSYSQKLGLGLELAGDGDLSSCRGAGIVAGGLAFNGRGVRSAHPSGLGTVVGESQTPELPPGFLRAPGRHLPHWSLATVGFRLCGRHTDSSMSQREGDR